MSNLPVDPDTIASQASDSDASFADILSEFEQSHKASEEAGGGRPGIVVDINDEFVVLDIGMKTEGVIGVADFRSELPKRGDELQVSITGRNSEGYYTLSLIQVVRPKDWSSLEAAFAEKRAIGGVVGAVVKGGLSVDVGVRAFMPASRSGARDAAEMEQLVGQEIRCQIIKLDVAEEDIVVDRRVVLEAEEKAARERLLSEIKEGTIVRGTVRSLADYGAFVDVGGVDGLLHVGDISWGRIAKPSDVLSVGQTVEVQVLKVDPGKRRISLGMKQLTESPWTSAQEKYQVGDRVHGIVTRLADFGAFVEIEPGLEGLIHISDMSWSRKVRKPSDVLNAGDSVEAVVQQVNPAERRMSLSLKKAGEDPWEAAIRQYPEGSTVEGPITSLVKFGAFVAIAEGVEGMIHVGDITNERRIDHPQDVLKKGETVKAVVLGIDREKRRIRLGMKQLQPTSVDEYIAEHKEGDVVTGRVAEISGSRATVDLGEGVRASCPLPRDEAPESGGHRGSSARDLSALSSMLSEKWKQGNVAGSSKKQGPHSGQVRSFRIVRLDPAQKRIDVELAG